MPLSGVLFCSPEVYTSNHKTELQDATFTAVSERLGATSGTDKDLWVWDAQQHKWSDAPTTASTLLLNHHKAHWAPLVGAAGWMCQTSGCLGAPSARRLPRSWCCKVVPDIDSCCGGRSCLQAPATWQDNATCTGSAPATAHSKYIFGQLSCTFLYYLLSFRAGRW